MIRYATAFIVAWGTCWCAVGSVRAQAVATGAAPQTPTVVEAVLNRTISLDLEHVRLDVALRAIAAKGGINLAYGYRALPLGKIVTIVIDRVSVQDALRAVLEGTGAEPVVLPGGHVVLEGGATRATPGDADVSTQPGDGIVTGRVTDGRTGDPLAGALVSVEGTDLRATAGADGRYTIRHIRPRGYRAAARSLGYRPATQLVTVTGDSTLHVDFALGPSPAVLDEVVTTVSGNQALKQLGNSIGTINVADSVVGRAPVTSLSDVLNARVAGVQVFNEGGMIGASPQINIRGQNSATLSNQPLLVIDGVRANNGSATPSADLFTESAGRLNDLVLEEIASIEIVKGPSAATLYGTDAANGVILVTTKHGERGRPQWSAYVEDGVLTVNRNEFPLNYTGWGHSTDGLHTLVQSCTLTMVATNQCAQDSITSFSPIRDATTTPIGTGNNQVYGGQVSGGGDTRYFFSGTYQDETGYLKMPTADKAVFRPIVGAARLSTDQLNPNGLTKYSLRNNVTTSIGPTLDGTINAAYLAQQSRIPISSVLSSATGGGPGYRDSANDGWQFGVRPGLYFIPKHEEDASHFTGGATANWRPASWFAGRGTVGIDQSTTYLDALFPANLTPLFPGGSRTNVRTYGTLYSIDLSATATANLWPGVTSRTTAGLQYHRSDNEYTQAAATQLSLGCQTVGCGISPSVSEGTGQSVIAGAFVEQSVGISERLYLTGAARFDGASSFGGGISAIVYPKASLSWLVSDGPLWSGGLALSHVRVRAAYGAAGVQPGPTAALASNLITPVFVDGQPAIGALLVSRGNPNLRSERQRELEGGIDADALHERMHLEATYYTKVSTDALFPVPVTASQVVPLGEENLGSVSNIGVEGVMLLQLLEGRAVSWSVGANASYNRNRLVKLRHGALPDTSSGGAGGYVPRYPIGALFDTPYTYSDKNNNGTIEPDEITFGAHRVYFGTTYPSVNLTLTNAVGLFGNRLHISVQVDHRGGNTIANLDGASRCAFPSCAAAFDPHASLASQAAAQAFIASGSADYAGFYSDGAFTRLREVALTYRLPDGAARAAHARTATLTLSGRNLAFWTRYTGTDPEVNGNLGAGSNQLTAFTDFGSLPPARYWLARLNLTF